MSPIAMAVALVVSIASLIYSLSRRWQMLKVGQPEQRLDRLGERIKVTLLYAFGQRRLPQYPLAGLGHILIFFGFLVLLLRSLMLWGRGFDPGFNLWVFGHEPLGGVLPLGAIYDLMKDAFAVLVVLGTLVFFYLRVVRKDKRMTLHWEGLAILGIIFTMMIADMLYDGSAMALAARRVGMGCDGAGGELAATCEQVRAIVAPYPAPVHAGVVWHAPAGSAIALGLAGVSPSLLIVLAHIGFWTHSLLVLIFANILPYTKHFHIITSIPNVFLSDLEPPGRLRPMAEGTEKLMEMVGAAAELEDPNAARIGAARLEHFTWKAMLDLYTCTECGRCTDNCPANGTGKLLSPKQFTLDLRGHLYGRADEYLKLEGSPARRSNGSADGEVAPGSENKGQGAQTESGEGNGGEARQRFKPVDLVPDVIASEVIWGCTTCRACEEVCPVMISYVDKMVDMRRHTVLVRGEFPPELQKPFQAMETNGNPWNLSRMDRAAWAEGLEIPTMADKPESDVLFWVGCAGSYDDRAKKIARATARLLKEAGVSFAILGEEESCTGDSARRAGNEFLFATLAEANVATLNGYKEKGGAKTILTMCPHCFNTLLHEYRDFGGHYDVVHHTDFLLDLVRKGKLRPTRPVNGRVVLHDSCYLGRYNGIYDSPRELLKAIPGLELVEPERFHHNLGLCCGAGGAQMWMEEQNKDRMNVRRTLQLLQPDPKAIATACPFCMTMITDGLKDREKEEQVRQLDVAELLEESCLQPRDKATAQPQEVEASKELAAATA